MATELWAVGLAVLSTFLGSCGALFLKMGAARASLRPLELVRNASLIGGIMMYVLATFIFIPALKGGELSILYPIISLSYVWAALLSMRFLGERMNAWKWLGILMILLGVGLIGVARSQAV